MVLGRKVLVLLVMLLPSTGGINLFFFIWSPAVEVWIRSRKREVSFGPCLTLWACPLVALWAAACPSFCLFVFQRPAQTTWPPGAWRFASSHSTADRSKFLSCYREGEFITLPAARRRPARRWSRAFTDPFWAAQRAAEWRSHHTRRFAVEEDHHGKPSNSKIWHFFNCCLFNLLVIIQLIWFGRFWFTGN